MFNAVKINAVKGVKIMQVANDVTDLIGNTPMLRLNGTLGIEGAEVLAKLEWYNIGGSVKDRMAKYLIEYAESAGILSREKTILEATSGNTGISLALIAAAKGFKITIVMPESVSVERRKLIRAYGAELILSPGGKGTSGAIELKRELLREHPETYVDIDQFSHPANVMAHYQTTGREIIEQTDGRVDAVVVGVGTAGTGVGASMRLKQFRESIRIIGVMPELGFAIQGLRNPNESNPTLLFRPESFDEIVELNPKQMPLICATAKRTAERAGLLIGLSAAAILYVTFERARAMSRDETIVAVLPDSGMKYLSMDIF